MQSAQRPPFRDGAVMHSKLLVGKCVMCLVNASLILCTTLPYYGTPSETRAKGLARLSPNLHPHCTAVQHHFLLW